MTFPTITMKEVEQYIDEGREMLLIDLRNPASYARCHLMGAVNVPYREIEEGRFVLPTDRMLVLYCSRGGQSLQASRILSRMGYQVVNVANGIAYYKGKYLL